MRILLVALLLMGCQERQWVKTTPDQFQMDKTACEARGYEVAGPYPVSNAQLNSFETAYSKGKAIRTWKKAFNSAVTACMNERGYSG